MKTLTFLVAILMATFTVPTFATPDSLPIGSVAELKDHAIRQVANVHGWVEESAHVVTNDYSRYKFRPVGEASVGNLFSQVREHNLSFAVTGKAEVDVPFALEFRSDVGENLFVGRRTEPVMPGDNDLFTPYIQMEFVASSIDLEFEGVVRATAVIFEGKNGSWTLDLEVEDGRITFPRGFAGIDGELVVRTDDHRLLVYDLKNHGRMKDIRHLNTELVFGFKGYEVLNGDWYDGGVDNTHDLYPAFRGSQWLTQVQNVARIRLHADFGAYAVKYRPVGEFGDNSDETETVILREDDPVRIALDEDQKYRFWYVWEPVHPFELHLGKVVEERIVSDLEETRVFTFKFTLTATGEDVYIPVNGFEYFVNVFTGNATEASVLETSDDFQEIDGEGYLRIRDGDTADFGFIVAVTSEGARAQVEIESFEYYIFGEVGRHPRHAEVEGGTTRQFHVGSKG